jgi:hypothetical protein
VQNAITDSSAGTSGYASSTSFGGDGVYVPAGSCSWSSAVVVDNQNVNIIGAGAGQTNITESDWGFYVDATNPAKGQFHISGFSILAPGASQPAIGVIGNGANASSYGWRIDHNTISDSGTTGADLFAINGPTWGLLDHNTISKNGGTVMQIADYISTESGAISSLFGQYSTTLPLGLGTQNAVYMENNTYTCTDAGAGCAIFDSSSGGQRTVFRYNTATNGYFYSHWTRSGELDGHKYEVYNNVFNGGAYGSGGGYPGRLESGTGVIFNNTFVGYSAAYVVIDERRGSGAETSSPLVACDGTHSWDGNYGDTNAPGWPCLGQIGRSTGYTVNSSGTGHTVMASVPLLAWNNSTACSCSGNTYPVSGSSCTAGACSNSYTLAISSSGGPRSDSAYLLNGAVATHNSMGSGNPGYGDADYCYGASQAAILPCGNYNTTYTPYTYPHPLAGSQSTVPAPTGLQATTN